MTVADTWDAGRLLEYLAGQYGPDGLLGVVTQVNGWLARGDGVAVYENADFGHPELGQCRLASYGSAEALLETGNPPERLPDTPTLINWRYRLKAVYRGRQLQPEEVSDAPESGRDAGPGS